MNSEKYIGLDVHQATISVAVLDSQGKLLMESILETKARPFLSSLPGYVDFDGLADYSHNDPKRQAISKVPECLLCGAHLKRTKDDQSSG